MNFNTIFIKKKDKKILILDIRKERKTQRNKNKGKWNNNIELNKKNDRTNKGENTHET